MKISTSTILGGSGTAIVTLTRDEIEKQQEMRMLGDAHEIARVNILDEKTGSDAWFVIRPVVKNGKPGIEILTGMSTRKRVFGKFVSD